ncbi:MAG: signal transduction histidine kinase/DNA-binding NarL/FixJ family response regulator, partial [Candidatus Pelagisphaera sp.]
MTMNSQQAVTEMDVTSTAPNFLNFMSKKLNSFQFRLFVVMASISIVPIVALTIWVERSAIEKEVAAVQEKHLMVASNLAMALSRYAVDIKNIVNVYAGLQNAGIEKDPDIVGAVIKNMDLAYIVTLDHRNRIVSQIAGDSNIVALPTPKLLIELRKIAERANGKVVFSGIERLAGKPYFFITKLITGGHIVFAPLSPRYVIQVQKTIAFGERGHSMVVDNRGRVIAHPNAQWQARSKDASKLSVVQKMISRKTGVARFYSPPMKADMIAGYTFVPETGWGVMVPQPTNELIIRARDVQFLGLIIGSIEITLVILISWWLSNSLSRPIRAITKAAQRVANGDLDARTDVVLSRAPYELKIFAMTFNEMLSDLQIKTNQLSQALAKAEEGSRTKSQFMAMMSHEIRTPMYGVLGVLELLEDTELDDEQKEYLSVAQSSGNSLMNIINDILDYSQLEAGRLEINAVLFDVTHTVEEVNLLFKPIVDTKGLKFETIIGNEVPAYLHGDLQRIRQVLCNLIGNAVKFTEHGSISTSIEYTAINNSIGILKISITDTGIGIPKVKQGELFEDFTQGDPSYSRKFGGTGLGLAISRRLTKLMGGEIGVQSVEGKGSIFWFHVPIAVAGSDPGAYEELPKVLAASPAERKTQRLNILVVDDTPTNGLVARKMLEKLGHSVDAALSGLEAIEAVTARRYDLVFMDISMPEMDGLKATAAIRDFDAPTGDVPIIALTAYAMKGDRERFILAGMDDYLSKPMVRAQMLRVLDEWGHRRHSFARSSSPEIRPKGATTGPDIDSRALETLAAQLDHDDLIAVIDSFIDDA